MSQIIQQRTNEKWTWGIVSIPLLFGNDNAKGVQAMTWVKNRHDCYKRLTSAMAKDKRYLLFEVDTQNDDIFKAIIAVYKSLKLNVYYHKTMRGFHFLSITPIERKVWAENLKAMMKAYNQGWVGMALRARPNKWINETDDWVEAGIIMHNGQKEDKELSFLRFCIEKQRIRAIAKKYKLVRYRMKE